MTDLEPLGLAVGHATDESGGTGATIIRGIERGFRASAATIGRATGTRDMHPLDPGHVVERVDAILLTGGSAYGLDAAAGAMRWLEERGRGHPVWGGVVPIVPAAVVFDLGPFGRFDARPTPQMVYDACDSARTSGIEEGSVGAGTGVTVGKVGGIERAMKGGVGIAVREHAGLHVAAIAVLNALGDVRDAPGRIIAGARDDHGGFLDSAALLANGATLRRRMAAPSSPNTTLAVVSTSASLSRVELAQLAAAASAALFRRITPAGTSVDGDVIFATALEDGPSVPLPQVEALAVLTLEDAIERAVRLARGRDGIPGLADERA